MEVNDAWCKWILFLNDEVWKRSIIKKYNKVTRIILISDLLHIFKSDNCQNYWIIPSDSILLYKKVSRKHLIIWKHQQPLLNKHQEEIQLNLLNCFEMKHYPQSKATWCLVVRRFRNGKNRTKKKRFIFCYCFIIG